MSIRKKLIAQFLIIATIPFFLVGILIYSNAKNALYKQQLEKLEALADLKVDKIKSFFYEQTSNIKAAQNYYNIKTNLPIVTKFADDESNPAYISARKMLDGQLKQFQKIYGYEDIMLVNPEGTIVYVTNEAHREKDVGNVLSNIESKAFEEGKEEVYFSDIYMNKENTHFEMMITAPAHDFNNKFVGVIVFQIDMTHIYKFIQDTTGLGKTGETLIGKKTGNTALFLNSLRHDPNAAFRRRTTIGSDKATAIQEAVQGIEGSGISIDYRDYEVIAVWRYIPLLDWGLVAKIDTEEAFALITFLRNVLTITLSIVLFLVTIVAFVSAKSISDPIIALTNASKSLASGNLSLKVDIPLKDEIGELANSFNKMTEDLENEMIVRKESEERFRCLLETIPDIVYKLDRDGYFIFVNNSIRSLGYEPEDLIGKHFIEIIHPDDVNAISASVVLPKYKGKITGNKNAPKIIDERRTGERITRDLEIRLIRKSDDRENKDLERVGEITAFVDLTASGLYGAQNSCKENGLMGTVGIIKDITEIKKSEKALKSYSKKLVETQESERKRIASELHDGLGTSLIAMKNEIISYMKSLPAKPKNIIKLDAVLDTMDQFVDDLRKISSDLRPETLDILGLEGAVESLVKKLSESSNIDICSSCNIKGLKISSESEINLYRIVQEGLANILKHSNADKAKVELINSNCSIILRISDNGKGFKMKSKNIPFATDNGFGFQGMYERAKIIGGSFKVDSQPGKGTMLTVTVSRDTQLSTI